jgi:WXG100 family type VII secretion target
MAPTSPVFGQAHGALGRAAGMVAEAKIDFELQSRRLDGQIDAIRGRWGGDGARAFFVLHQAWHEQHAIVVRALDRFHSSLLATEQDNTRVDQQAGDVMHRLAGQLGAV